MANRQPEVMPKAPQRLVFIEMDAKMGGVEFSTLYLAQNLNKTYWQPLVICPTEGVLPEACRRTGVEVQIVPRPALRSTSIWLGQNRRLPNPVAWSWNIAVILFAAYSVTRFLAVYKPAVVVTKGLLAHFYGGLAAKWQHIPCLWHVQDFVSERFGGIYRRGFGLMARWLPHSIVVDGQPIARQLPKAVQSKVNVVYNGVDTAILKPGLNGAAVRRLLNIPSTALIIGHVARMTPWKGQHHLLEAFARLASEFPDCYLLLVGTAIFDDDRYERYLNRRVQELQLGDRVIFAGYRTDLPQVLLAMDIFAYPSTEKDTSPLALLSAMAVGLPIVAFDIEGLREVLGPDAVGILIPLNNPPGAEPDIETFAQALRELLNNAGYRRNLGCKARHLAVEKFSLDRYVSNMERILQQVKV